MTSNDSGDAGPEPTDGRSWDGAKIAALEDLRDELQSEPVEESRLAGLYEQVSTSPPQLWNRATAFIDVEEREPTDDANRFEEAGDDRQGTASAEAVVTDVSKLARGWWSPEIVEGCDAMVTVDVHHGLPPENFVSLATAELDEAIEAIREDETDERGSPL